MFYFGKNVLMSSSDSARGWCMIWDSNISCHSHMFDSDVVTESLPKLLTLVCCKTCENSKEMAQSQVTDQPMAQ